MQIVNPIYDVVFKMMMQDLRIAKFFISTIIGENIDEITPQPQENIYTSETLGLSVIRFDYSAKIKTTTGEFKTVMIEVQKSHEMLDLMRFRNYLAEQYKKEEIVGKHAGIDQKAALPIITIYMLGFKLPDLEYCAVKANRDYIDLETGETINVRSQFIEKLTHDGYFLQLLRLEPRLQTKLGRLLSIFEQKYFIGQLNDKKEWIKEYTYEVTDPDLKYTLDILQKSTGDKALIAKIEGEEVVFRALEIASQNKSKELEVQLEEAQKREEEERKQKEEAQKREEKAQKQKEEAQKREETAIVTLYTNSKMPVNQIAAIFQIQENEVRKVLLKNGVGI